MLPPRSCLDTGLLPGALNQGLTNGHCTVAQNSQAAQKMLISLTFMHYLNIKKRQITTGLYSKNVDNKLWHFRLVPELSINFFWLIILDTLPFCKLERNCVEFLKSGVSRIFIFL